VSNAWGRIEAMKCSFAGALEQKLKGERKMTVFQESMSPSFQSPLVPKKIMTFQNKAFFVKIS
jgi:hypothetical protein